MQISNTEYRWIIVQDDENSISSRPCSNEMKFWKKNMAMFFKKCIGQFVVYQNNVFLYLTVYFLCYDSLEKLFHNGEHYLFNVILFGGGRGGC